MSILLHFSCTPNSRFIIEMSRTARFIRKLGLALAVFLSIMPLPSMLGCAFQTSPECIASIEPSFAAKGRVFLGDGTPLVGITLRMTLIPVEASRSSVSETAITDDAGQFEVKIPFGLEGHFARCHTTEELREIVANEPLGYVPEIGRIDFTNDSEPEFKISLAGSTLINSEFMAWEKTVVDVGIIVVAD